MYTHILESSILKIAKQEKAKLVYSLIPLRAIIDVRELIDSKEKSSWICIVSFTVECVLCQFFFNFVSELENALPSNSDELFDVQDFFTSPKHEIVPFGSLSIYSGRYKLESDTQELGSICFDNEGTSQIFHIFLLMNHLYQMIIY